MPPLLEVIAFRTIFQAVLKKWRYNLPTAFFVMCSLEGLIPDQIVENMFGLIEGEYGEIKQTIVLFSYDPSRLAGMLSNMMNLRTHVQFLRRPIHFERTRFMSYLFSDVLKSVRGHVVPHIDRPTRNVLRGVRHTIKLTFKSLRFENDTYTLNHKGMTSIVFHFPKIFDLPKFSPSLYTALKYARSFNVQPQPKFVDENCHVKLSARNSLFMSYTYACPSCSNAIFEYNCISQRYIIRSFDHHDLIRKKLCECICCTKEKYRNIKFP